MSESPEQLPLAEGPGEEVDVVVPELRDLNAEDTMPKGKETEADAEVAGNKAVTKKSGSMVQRLRSVKQESKNPAQTVQQSLALICATFVCTILQSVIQLVIAVVSIAIGAHYLNDCPVQNYIPIYLVVTGTVTLANFVVTLIWNYYQGRRKAKENRGEELPPPGGCCRCLILLRAFFVLTLALFSMAWFIAGSVWVYGIYGKYSQDEQNERYCNQTVYKYAFVLITLAWCLLGATVLIVLCACCIACMM